MWQVPLGDFSLFGIKEDAKYLNEVYSYVSFKNKTNNKNVGPSSTLNLMFY